MFQKKKVTKHYIKNIRICDDDSYSWQELNCFFRPFAIAMGKERYHLFLLLISMYMTHYNVDNGKALYNRLHPSLLYFQNELKDVLCASIMVEEYSSERDMHKKMEKALADGEAVIIPYDLYVLPYSQNYMEQHHRHYMLVKGFDSQKEIYYLFDNMHNELGESVVYSDFMIQYHQMYMGADAFHRSYNGMCCSKPYFWKIQADSTIREMKENVREYLIKVLEGLISGNLEPYYVEWDMINGSAGRHMLDNVEQINQRNVYYGEFIKFFDEMGYHYDDVIVQMTEELKKNWNLTKLQIMRGNADAAVRLERNISLERNWHKKVLEILSGGNDMSKDETTYGYMIVNELNAGLVEMDGKWKISLLPDLVYDTWKLKDDACQILYPVDDNTAGIEAAIHKKAVNPGSAFHFGLILKSNNFGKILFGNSRDIHLVIFEPEKESYEIYQSDYCFDDVDRFKVEFINRGTGMEYVFCIMDSITRKWNEIYKLNIKGAAEYAGVFVKSWERCRCVVEVEMEKVSKNN